MLKPLLGPCDSCQEESALRCAEYWKKVFMNWQPIESAPKDGTFVLLGNAKVCADGFWLQEAYAGNGAWIWPYVHQTPTHWMPLIFPLSF